MERTNRKSSTTSDPIHPFYRARESPVGVEGWRVAFRPASHPAALAIKSTKPTSSATSRTGRPKNSASIATYSHHRGRMGPDWANCSYIRSTAASSRSDTPTASATSIRRDSSIERGSARSAGVIAAPMASTVRLHLANDFVHVIQFGQALAAQPKPDPRRQRQLPDVAAIPHEVIERVRGHLRILPPAKRPRRLPWRVESIVRHGPVIAPRRRTSRWLQPAGAD